MKKISLILFLLSIFSGHAQITQPTNATDWNSTRSNKTSKTTRTGNPNGNDSPDKPDKNIHQLGMIIERIPVKGPNYYVSMPNKELTAFNKKSNQEKKLYFSDFIAKTIKRINPEDNIDNKDIMGAILTKWCGPCRLTAKNAGGIIEIKENDFVYKIYFSRGGRTDVEKVVIKDKTEGTDDPSFAIDPDGGFCYRQLDLNIPTTLEPMPEEETVFCMDETATQRVGNDKHNKTRYFFVKRIIKKNPETQSKDIGNPHNKYIVSLKQANPNQENKSNDKIKDYFAKKRMAKNSSPKKDINIGVAYGLSRPSSGYKDDTYAGNGHYFEFSGAYYFSKWGLGLSIGQITNPTDSNLSDFTRNLDFSVANNSENIKSTYIGLGPEYKLKLNKFETTFQIRAGMYAVNSFALEGDNVDNPDVTVPFFSLNSEETTTLGFVSTGVKFDYNITNNLSLFASAGYLTALSDKLVVTESKIEDLNNNGIIDKEDFRVEDGSVQYSIREKNSTPSALNLGFGISYYFGSSTKNQENVKIPDNESDNENLTQRGKRKAKRECLEAGGSFWEHSDGSYFCMNQITNIRISSDTNSEDGLHRNGKRKCWKAGGTWVTNSHGSFCWNPSASSKVINESSESIDIKEVIKKKEAVKNSLHPQNPQNDNSQNKTAKNTPTTRIENPNDEESPNNEGVPNPIHATDWNSTRSNKTSKTTRMGNPNENNPNQAAKNKCLKSGGIFWQNADGSYSCRTTIKKSHKIITISNKLNSELTTAKKAAIADKTQQGVIEINVVYADKSKTLKVSIPSNRIQNTESILLNVIEVTKGNGDEKGKVRVKYVAKL